MSDTPYRHRRQKSARRGGRPKVVVKDFRPTPKGRFERAPGVDLKLRPVVDRFLAVWAQWRRNPRRVDEIVDGAATVWPFPGIEEFVRHDERLQAELRAPGAGVR